MLIHDLIINQQRCHEHCSSFQVPHWELSDDSSSFTYFDIVSRGEWHHGTFSRRPQILFKDTSVAIGFTCWVFRMYKRTRQMPALEGTWTYWIRLAKAWIGSCNRSLSICSSFRGENSRLICENCDRQRSPKELSVFIKSVWFYPLLNQFFKSLTPLPGGVCASSNSLITKGSLCPTVMPKLGTPLWVFLQRNILREALCRVFRIQEAFAVLQKTGSPGLMSDGCSNQKGSG